MQNNLLAIGIGCHINKDARQQPRVLSITIRKPVLGARPPPSWRNRCIIAFAVLFLAANRWVSFALVKPLERSCLPSFSPPTAYAMVILGMVAVAFPPQQKCAS
jgi:hypothetical protein